MAFCEILEPYLVSAKIIARMNTVDDYLWSGERKALDSLKVEDQNGKYLAMCCFPRSSQTFVLLMGWELLQICIC